MTNAKDSLYHQEPKNTWYSLGYSCQILQVVPGQLHVLMEAIGAKFGQVVDDVPYLRGDVLQQVAYKVAEVRNEIAEARQAAPSN